MMKFTLSVFFFLLLTSLAFAQQPDSGKAGKKRQKNDMKREFVDHNGNGIDDRKEMKLHQRQERRGRRKDHFIDRDGDGIADHREGDMMGRNRKKSQRSRHRR